MAAPTCQQCGGPNPVGALNCQWCGATLPPPPLDLTRAEAERASTPLSFDSEPESTPSGARPPVWPARAVIAIVIAVFLVGLVLAIASYQPQSPSETPLPGPPSAPVNVTSIRIVSSDNVCGLNGTTRPGFTGNADAFSGLTWKVTAPPGGCTISGISADTSGFVILTLDLPITIAGGQTGSFSFSLELPPGGYDGPLVVSLN